MIMITNDNGHKVTVSPTELIDLFISVKNVLESSNNYSHNCMFYDNKPLILPNRNQFVLDYVKQAESLFIAKHKDSIVKIAIDLVTTDINTFKGVVI